VPERLAAILPQVPLNTLVVVMPVPLDPLTFLSAVWAQQRPLATTDAFHKACDRHLGGWKLGEVQAQWERWVVGHLAPPVAQSIMRRSRYVCLPSMIIAAKYAGDAQLANLATEALRRQYLVFRWAVPRLPRLGHWIGWVVGDGSHVLGRSWDGRAAHGNVPWTDRQFVTTLVCGE
jgi:hypothetical protein